ncbi:unnamed protein product [Boreogadus saida]
MTSFLDDPAPPSHSMTQTSLTPKHVPDPRLQHALVHQADPDHALRPPKTSLDHTSTNPNSLFPLCFPHDGPGPWDWTGFTLDWNVLVFQGTGPGSRVLPGPVGLQFAPGINGYDRTRKGFQDDGPGTEYRAEDQTRTGSTLRTRKGRCY